ncbi:hypothetical protein SKAU_G00073720 [Synaphobranchus kaupii]|uniref:SMB domain-containing protein n=1 Tax=Synaphobranchus kaupii TaxID=118154 RepID=A0A9Q1G799_SYNKA|nr:hypothetical protein SKAU_G00073720 [Synaphobranchus kaupii]
MDSSTALFGLLLLCHWEGHLNSANLTTTTQSAVTSAGFETTMHTRIPAIDVSLEASNPKTSNASITTLFPLPSFINTTIQVIPFSHKCSEFPPLCCDELNSTCNRGCFCDEVCLRLGDCCPDFSATCITGEQIGTSANVTVLPGNNSTNTTLFPLSFYSGNCSEEPALCCSGVNMSCFRGCFCDEFCKQANDCCSDYANTCTEVITIIGRVKVSLRVPLGTEVFNQVGPTTVTAHRTVCQCLD